MLNGMIWLAKSGAMWEGLPERYGPWKTVYSRFCKWCDEGVLAAIFTALSMDADYENLGIDSSSIKVHQHASSGKRGANPQIRVNQGGKTTKIHAVVDALGNPVYLQLSAGNIHDCKVAEDVLSHVEPTESMVLDDRGYDADEILIYIEDQDARHTIPPKANRLYQRKCDWWLY